MILKYGVESKHTTSFTGSKRVKDMAEAERQVAKFRRRNAIVGYMKYFSVILYTDDNIRVRFFQF